MNIPELIRTDPTEARRALTESFRQAGASQTGAAAYYQVTKSTFSRWVRQLSLQGEFRSLTRLAAEQGWDQRGRRGPDQGSSKARVKAQRIRRKKERTT
jgi:hypothetical protein